MCKEEGCVRGGVGHDDFYIASTAASLGNTLEFLSLLCYYIPISHIPLYIIQFLYVCMNTEQGSHIR